VDASSIAAAAVSQLARDEKFDVGRAQKALDELGVNNETVDPAVA